MTETGIDPGTDTDLSGDETIAGYIRVSTSDQDAGRQRDSIEATYGEGNIEWYADLGESGADATRPEYQRLQDDIESGEIDVLAAHELDRLGRSFSELASFVDFCDEHDVGIDLVNQPVDTTGDSWMGEMMLNMLIVFADAERAMIQDRVTQGVKKTMAEGKHVGRPPLGYDVDEEGFLVQNEEFGRVQQFIREVKKGRPKRPTARAFGIPEGSVQSVLANSEEHYDIPFENDSWKVDRARVEAGEKELEPLKLDE
ncbi:Site-specific DNA recombinase [Halovenus aranensis]|uniref:Site-specific DNA recombinase n=1 Tax=Halovenus aranensis TaxID=890420 RepID=A0A1G8X7I1_9EURY|nr:recombinase family protein [Halovenus aranensis]SDJ86618.1 Site-specific DNA recombinase [Halovenus aranensis]